VDSKEARSIFEEHHAIVCGVHVAYVSGQHGDTYIDKDRIYAHPESTSALAVNVAWGFMDDDIDVVVGPEKGGIILAQWVAFHLGRLVHKPILSFYAEKNGPLFVLRRGNVADQICGRNVLLVEDILHTGISVQKTADAVARLGGNIVGVGAFWNRGPHDIVLRLGIPKCHVLIAESFNDWSAEICPLCEQHIPLNRQIGRGKNIS